MTKPKLEWTKKGEAPDFDAARNFCPLSTRTQKAKALIESLAGLNARIDFHISILPDVFAIPVLGGQASLGMGALIGPNTTSALGTVTGQGGASLSVPERTRAANCQSACGFDPPSTVKAGVAATVQGQVVGESGGLALSAKAKRRNTIAISRDDLRAKPLPNDQRSAIRTDSLAMPSSVVDDRSPQSRKRTIMARYVFGDELKPGERWKRRLLTSR